ncbi:MAG: 2-dehydropantoate 2-reductase [Anaerolineae bacterium]|nr:MAG: 2-dehydropantoate 2-reductase [Anaerolineae bacterium]
MRIAVFGSGAVGGYFGARLLQAGETVSLIARGEHLRALQTHGLQVSGASGTFTVQPHLATDNPAEVGEVELILVGVKAWQIPEAAEAMRPLVGEKTTVLPLQNGVEAPFQLAEALGKQAVLGGLCQISAYLAAPGRIHHVGIEPTVVFGELNRRSTARLQLIREVFERAGVRAQIAEDIHVALWDKFLFIAAFSAVGAASRVGGGLILQTPPTRQLLEEVMREIWVVARAAGVPLPAETIARRLSFVEQMPPHAMASMARDLIEGRPSELEQLIGAVVRLGERYEVATPLSRALYAALLPQEQLARGNRTPPVP